MYMDDTAIIGGGATGLCIAYYFKKLIYYKKKDLTIIEASPDVGGLAGYTTVQGELMEKFYHHIFQTDTNIIELINELGLGNKLYWVDDYASMYDGTYKFKYAGPIDILKAPILNPYEKLRLITVLAFFIYYPGTKYLKKLTAYEWGERFLPRNVNEQIIVPLLKAKFSTYYKDIASVWLRSRFESRGKSKGKLGYMEGSFAPVFEKLKEKLIEEDVKFIFNKSVPFFPKNKIIDGKKYYKLIYTTPVPTKLSPIEYLGALSLIIELKVPLMADYWLSITDKDNPPFLVIVNQSYINKKLKNVYYLSGYYKMNSDIMKRMSQGEIESLFFTYLKKIFPKFDKSDVIKTHLFKKDYAQPIVGLDYEAKIPPFMDRYRNSRPNVLIVNMSQIFPQDRGMNYAVKLAKYFVLNNYI